MLKLYYSPGTCSLAPHVVLEELALPYELVPILLAESQQESPQYLAVNPKGRIPALADGTWLVTETPAILRFLARQRPDAGLWPDDPREEARCAEWLNWISSTVHVAFAHVGRPYRWAQDPKAREDVAATGLENCRKQWAAVEAALPDGPWALGERYSVVDSYLIVYWRFGRGPKLGFDMTTFPKWTGQMRRMLERPAVRRVFEQERLEIPALTR